MANKINLSDFFDFSDGSVVEQFKDAAGAVRNEYSTAIKELTRDLKSAEKAHKGISAEILKFKEAAQQANTSTKEGQEQTLKLNEAFAKSSKIYKDSRIEIANLKAEKAELAKNVKLLQDSYKKFDEGLAKAKKSTEAQAGSTQDLKVKTAEAKKVLDSLSESIDPVAKTKALENYSKLKQELDKSNKSTQDAVKGNTSAIGSYNALQKEVAELDKEYKNLPDALGKNKVQAEALRKTLFEKRQVLKDLDSQMNVYNRNVGNYRDVLKDAALSTNLFGGRIAQTAQGLQNTQQSLKLVTGGIRGFGAALAATGIGALLIALGALVAVFTKTDAGGERLERVFAGVGAIVDMLTLKIIKVGEFLIDVFDSPGESIKAFGSLIKDFVLQRIELLMGGIKGLGAALNLLFEGKFKEAAKTASTALVDINRGINPMAIAIEVASNAVNKLGKEFSDSAREAKRLFDAAVEIKRAMQELEDAQRVFGVTSTKTRFEIDELILSSKDLNKSYDERRAALKKAGVLELEVTQQEVELARKELNNLLDQNRLNTGLSREQLLRFGTDLKAYEEYAEQRGIIGDADLDKQAELQKKLIEVEANSALKQQEIRNRLSKFDDAELDAIKKRNEEITKANIKPIGVEEGNNDLKSQLGADILARAEAYEKDLANYEAAQKEKTRIQQEEDALRAELQQEATNLGIQIANIPFEQATERRAQELEDLQAQKAIELELAGDNAAQKERLLKEFDRKERKIKREQAIADREQALFNIAIATAVAAIKSLAAIPLPAGAVTLALTLALGAIQAAAVLAKPLPKFEKGTTYAPEGFAIVDEKGQEAVERNGKVYLGQNKGPRLTYLKAGDKVRTAEETRRMLANQMPMKVLDSYNQGYEKLSNIQLGTSIDYDKLASKLNPGFEKVAETIKNKPSLKFKFSKGDLRAIYQQGNMETEFLKNQYDIEI